MRNPGQNKAAAYWRRERRLPAIFLALLLFSRPAGICRGQDQVRVERTPKYIAAQKGTKPLDVTRHVIPLPDIVQGGPPRDGIPALTRPAFVSVTEADRFLNASDVVLGVQFDGNAKAYPVRILNWHEVVNDDVGSQPVLVTW